MAKGISLNIGVNSCSAEHYRGWTGPLKSCERDAQAIFKIANNMGYESQLLLTEKATRSNVINAIVGSAKQLDSSDALIVSFSGHGGKVPDKNGDEEDNTDETWCLYDGQLIDDELAELWSGFQPGVRILLISDSCHSGTVSRGGTDVPAAGDSEELLPKMMPDDAAFATYKSNAEFYSGVMSELPKIPTPIKATVQSLSACLDEQLSYDGKVNAVYTTALLKVWNDGKFSGSYKDFFDQIFKAMPEWQTPFHSIIGAANSDFATQRPFEI